MHCTPSVVKKFGTLGGNVNSPASRSSVRTTRKLAPYRTPGISYRSTKSRGGLVPFAESLRGPRCLNPINSVGNSSLPLCQEEGEGLGQWVRVTIALGWLSTRSGKLGVTRAHPRSRESGHTRLSRDPDESKPPAGQYG